MGRLNRIEAEAAIAGRDSVAAAQAKVALRRRGVRVALGELGARTLAECIDAIGWARNRRPLSLRPSWLGALVAAGRARLMSGTCSVCGCTDRQRCYGGCSWVSARRTLCTRCDPRSVPVRGLRAVMNRHDRRAQRSRASRYYKFCVVLQRALRQWIDEHPDTPPRFVMPERDVDMIAPVAAIVSLISKDEPTRVLAQYLADLGDDQGRGGTTLRQLRAVLESLRVPFETAPIDHFGRLVPLDWRNPP